MPLYRQRVIETRTVEIDYVVIAASEEDVQEILTGDDTLGEIVSDSHDFWLTARGHGCGYLDGDLTDSELGDHLTEAAQQFAYIESWSVEPTDGQSIYIGP